MNDHHDIESIMAHKGVRPTANRILVLKALSEGSGPMSLVEIENAMPTMERSTIFRSLTTLTAADVLHCIEDGMGTLKYEICTGRDECTSDDRHAHFYCTECHRTYCFKTERIPDISYPEGFEVQTANYLAKGVCPMCKKQGETSR